MFPQKESGFLNQLEMLQMWMKEKANCIRKQWPECAWKQSSSFHLWQVLLFAETSYEYVKLP